MIQTIDRSIFIETFKIFGRADNFSHWGLNKLWEYFEELEDSTGEQIEFDCVAICCEYNEEEICYAKGQYDKEDLTDEEFIEYLQDHTQLVAYDDENVIYQAF